MDPVTRLALVRRLRRLGFEGPFAGAKHQFMLRGDHTRPDLLEPEVMQAPIVWLASAASDGFNGRRIIAQLWDEELPLEERLAKASAPAAWPQLGRPTGGP